jgi:hypothetical protein
LRLLYLTYHPNALSESYARTEIEWLQGRGVDVHLLAKAVHGVESGYASTVNDISIGESLPAAVARVKPDVVHSQSLVAVTRSYEHDLRAGVGVPVTIKSHSFDFQPNVVARLVDIPAVKKLWLFPHYVDMCAPHPKICGITSCFPDCYKPGTPKRPPQVVRVMAGLASKNIEPWLAIATMCPDVSFALAMTTPVPPEHEFPHQVKKILPPNVTMFINLQQEEILKLVGESSISLTTSPSHHPGMPVSLCEAMATGLAVVSPDNAAARAYLGPAGSYYTTLEEAADHIKRLCELDRERWEDVRVRSTEWSARYHADVVLPDLLTTWESLL